MQYIGNGIWKLTLGTPELKTPMTMVEHHIKQEGLEDLPKIDEPPIRKIDVNYSESSRGCKVELPMDNSEDFYGFGLQLHSVNQAGRRRYIKVNSDPVANTGEGHAPVPFFVSTAGYGVYVDTYRYATFLMGTNSKKGEGKKCVKEVKEHVEFAESALYALKKSEEERNIIIDIPAAKGVDLYFFAGPDLKTAVARYNLFSGGGAMPPMWGLGTWYRAYGGANQNDVAGLANRLREDGLPIDVFGIEPGWHTHSYSCSYKWADRLFPAPYEMIDTLKEQGFKINLWEHIFVHPTAEFYEELMPYAGEYEVWGGLVPDLALEGARDIFIKHHTEHFIGKGIMGFKLDECDNSDYNPSNWSFPDSSTFPSGFDGEQMHNAVGVFYQQTLLKAFKDQGIRTLSEVRSSGALASALPFVLYSDLYKHEEFIKGVVTSGFSGLLWAPEIRSCDGIEDLVRRIQSGTFSHQLLLNCWRIPNPPWDQVDIEKNLAGEKMAESESVKAICKKFFELRMQLLPYLYAAFANYHYNGMPPVRALVMDYPNDIKVRQIEDEYLFGESLLVAPLTAKQGEEREVYLPEGNWFDFFTHEKYEGGKTYTIKAPLEKIPVFVKDGALIPMAQSMPYVDKDSLFEISFTGYGEGEKSFRLYEDDGESFAFEKGEFNWIEVKQTEDGKVYFDKKGNYTGKRYNINSV